MPCGDCKWWESRDDRNQYGNAVSNSRGHCQFPLPMIMLQQINNYNDTTRANDGWDCKAYKEKDQTNESNTASS